MSSLERALALGPERIEINVYVSSQSGDIRQLENALRAERNALDPGDIAPPGLRVARRVLDQWPSMSDEERQEWRHLADAIRTEEPRP